MKWFGRHVKPAENGFQELELILILMRRTWAAVGVVPLAGNKCSSRSMARHDVHPVENRDPEPRCHHRSSQEDLPLLSEDAAHQGHRARQGSKGVYDDIAMARCLPTTGEW